MNILRIIEIILVTSLVVFNSIGYSQVASDEEGTGREYYLFVGSYTQNSDKGIYVYRFNSSDGSLTPVSSIEGGVDPSYLAISPDHKYVYATNEYRYSEENGGEVSAFSFDKEKGSLSFINKVSSHGNSPCYISLDKSGQFAFVANYSGGSFAMLPINNDGSLGEANMSIKHEGRGPGNRQRGPHVHCAIPTPDYISLIVADLGTDRLSQYTIDADGGRIQENETAIYKAEPGAGPRHLTFHPNGEYAYLVNELNGTVVAFSYQSGRLNSLQTISTLPDGYDGAVSGADIHVSPDGKYLYATNRGDLNNLVIYSIDQQSGLLSVVGSESSGGVHPRNFTIDPSGNYLLIANQDSNNIVVFKRNKETGGVSPTGTEIELSQPVCLKMIPVE